MVALLPMVAAHKFEMLETATTGARLPTTVDAVPVQIAAAKPAQNRFPSLLWLSLTIGTLFSAFLFQVQGEMPIAAVGLLLAGMASLSAYAFAFGARYREAAIRASEARNRLTTLETLSDRMWELQESEERFRGLLDALGDVVVHRDREGRIAYANQVLGDLVGIDPRLLTGRRLIDIGVDISLVPDAAFANGECLSSTDVAVQTRDGLRWFSWIEHSTRDKASDAVSHKAIARDITARKKAETEMSAARERAEYASQAKSRFLATVSHEIRTPMNGIIGMAKLLADTDLSPEQQTYVGAVSTSAGHLLALIEDLLDYSKIEAGRFDIEPQMVSPRELSENVTELLAARAFAKGIGLGVHVARDVPARISTDPGRLRQVLLNLIGNAVKFTEVGGVMVYVSVDVKPETPQVIFAVRDTGPGLKQSDATRIFEEFEQADTTTTRPHGGAGLGLAISKRIVEAMNGTIGISAEPGRGATFTVALPLENPVPPASERADALKGCRVVILSQVLVEAEALAMTIHDHGGQAVVATSVEDAASCGDYNLVLIDAQLEDIQGSRLAAIRAAGLRDAHAITLIAPHDRGQLPQLRANGYANFLARPVREETLIRVLLAAHAAKVEQIARPAVTLEPLTIGGGSLSVLVAEDNEINALLARATLAKAGHSVQVVGNGRAAVDALVNPGARQAIDVVLMDLHMPVMDGLDAIAMIRKHEEEKGLAPVPIIVLSADGQERTRHHVLAHGATGFVTKPLDPAALVDAIEAQAA